MLGCTYNGASYVFRKDLLGNIIQILDSVGNVVVKYEYDAWGNHKVLNAIGTEITDMSHIGHVNLFRYRGYTYDETSGLYYLLTRFYDPETGRFLNMDTLEYAEPTITNGLNLYAYGLNNPIMYVDPTGYFPILAVILCGVALVGMGLTISGVATDNNILAAVGLGMVGTAALVSGGIALAGAIATGATLTGIIGGVTAIAGLGSLGFMSAEIQEAAGNGNWIMDTTGMSEGLYNTLLLSTAAIATLGTFASSFAYSFNISSIDKVGKLVPANHPDTGYFGIRYKTGRGSLQSFEFQKHAPHGFHYQRNIWNPNTMKITSKKALHWTWYLKRF